MSSNTIYYVYRYDREDGTPYYIGKGKEDRCYSYHRKVKRPDDESRIIIVQDNMSEQDAFDLEEHLIEQYGRKDLGTGILRNMSRGGLGRRDPVVTQETREKLRFAHLGKQKSQEHCDNISKGRKGIVFTDTHCDNISKSRIGNTYRKLNDYTIDKIRECYLSGMNKTEISKYLKVSYPVVLKYTKDASSGFLRQ